MSTTRELTPAEKARRTKLINEGVELSEQKKQAEARIKEIQADLWPAAEEEIEASGGKGVTFQGTRGSCEIARVTSISIADVGGLRDALGDRFEELVLRSTAVTMTDEALGELHKILGSRFADLVRVEEKHSLSNGLQRIVQDPQPQERKLSEQVRECLAYKTSSRFTFRPAA